MNIFQDTKFQHLEFNKKPILISSIVRNYIKNLEVIFSVDIILNKEVRAGSKLKIFDLDMVNIRVFTPLKTCGFMVSNFPDFGRFKEFFNQ